MNWNFIVACSYPTSVNSFSKTPLYFDKVYVSSLLKSNQISALKPTVDGVFDEMNRKPFSLSDISKFYPIR
jgi:hypothetical protein